jgi:hypothetical protein
MATATDDFWLKLLFKVKLYEASGDSFQQLFSRVMELSNPNFQSIIPWGSWGDGGNDGWIESDGHYFQVYGPRPTTKDSETEALNKAVSDFNKIPKKWANVKRYSFVLNDRYCGIPAPIASALQQLKISKSLLDTGTIGCKELTTHFMGLLPAERQEIIPGIPSARPEFVDSRCVGELLSNLADNANGGFSFLSGNAPDFDEKIKINGLTSPIAESIKFNFWHVSTVDDFLNSRGSGLQQAIADEIRELYKASKDAIPDTDPDAPNARYVWLVEKLIPPVAQSHPHSVVAYRNAAQIVISKYFETCDAYEHPVSLNSAQAHSV